MMVWCLSRNHLNLHDARLLFFLNKPIISPCLIPPNKCIIQRQKYDFLVRFWSKNFTFLRVMMNFDVLTWCLHT